MRIRKFNESGEVDDISNERVGEILESMKKISAFIDDKKDEIQSLTNELSKFKSNSNKSNDQIDDTVSTLESIKSKMDDLLSGLDTINNNLIDYTENGRRYLY
jgi:ABC-type transporter Mla subunit MlaD